MEQKVTPLGTMIDELTVLRKQKTDATDILNGIKDEIDDLEQRIRETMNAVGLESASGKFDTVTPKVEDYPTIEDPDTFIEWAAETDNLHLLQKRLSAPSVREYAKHHEGEMPPGVGTFEKHTLAVRKRR